VVSGLARGIDSAAHRGALAAGGLTCAVLPCGLESCYPLSNRGLAATILEKGGLLVTEYPPGTEIRKHRFPERNRIITGLARGLLVVEAPAGSGALISADFALEQGREVYIAASRMGGARSAGLDLLAEEGAALLSSPGELLRDWGLAEPSAPGAATAEGRASETDWRGEGVEGASIEGSSMAAALRAELGMEGGAGSTRF
jgi:DNA processing protein